jgi:hypothetical protein
VELRSPRNASLDSDTRSSFNEDFHCGSRRFDSARLRAIAKNRDGVLSPGLQGAVSYQTISETLIRAPFTIVQICCPFQPIVRLTLESCDPMCLVV